MSQSDGPLWHQQPSQRVLDTFETDASQGLSSQKAQENLNQYGKNAIQGQKGMSGWKRFLLQFHNPLIYILLVATIVTLIFQYYVDSIVIFAVVFVNAVIGYVQEAKAEQAIQSLKNMLSSSAVVLRDGQKVTIDAQDIVPGDVVYLQSGDKVPADMRLLTSHDLQVDESALTGESVAVQKQPEALEAETVLGDRTNMAFAGTLVTYGQGFGVVVATAHATETGKIADMIANVETLDTPLTKKIHAFSQVLLWGILVLAALTFFVGMLHGESAIEMFLAAVALAVAAIPEGLPAVVTITLAIGVRRMARRNAIIRKLPAVETLGSTMAICSDKTGTLTENQMTVQAIYAGQSELKVSGSGYQPSGKIATQDDHSVHNLSDNHALQHTLACGVLCNDSSLLQHDDRWQVQGDPTEGALLTSGIKAGLRLEQLQNEYPRIDSIPFESDRQYMVTLHQTPDQQYITYTKGALEQVLARCNQQMMADGSQVPLDVDLVKQKAEALASQGLRVLAFAMKASQQPLDLKATFDQDNASDLVLIGLQAMIDPPRQEAVQAVATCQRAGIAVKMITGDHALTAKAIADQIGVHAQSDQLNALTGAELAALDDDALLQRLDDTAVFARVSPDQKLRLVNLLQKKDYVVAMTGDGVNDAPALKQADIGVAMGIAGTEVSKESADMILTDDNFASIEAAVEEGRTVFDNLLKFITWILPTNVGQGMVIVLAILLGMGGKNDLPILPVQALWLNMTTAVFLGLMLAFEPKEPAIMLRNPRAPGQSFLSADMIVRIFTVSGLLLIGAFGLFGLSQVMGASPAESRTIAVTLFVFVQSYFLLNCRSLDNSIFQMNWFSNMWIWSGIIVMMAAQLLFIFSGTMNWLFGSAPITSPQIWLLMILYGAFVLFFVELEKSIWRARRSKNHS